MSSTLDNPNAVPVEVPFRSTAVRGGLITALVLIALGLVLQVTGISDPSNSNATAGIISGLLSFVLMAGGLIWAIRSQKSEQNGYLTLGRGIAVGMLATLIISVIMAVWMIVNFMFIQPDAIELMMDGAREQMYKQNPNMSDSDADQAMSFMKWMFNPYALAIIGLVTTLVQGLIISLIGSAILKNNPPQSM